MPDFTQPKSSRADGGIMRTLQAFAVLGGLVVLSACSSGGPDSAPGGNGLEITEKVTYRPETIVVPTDKAGAAILERADDDSSFLLDGSVTELAGLTAGRVLLLGGVTLRKVTNVTMEGANLRVTTDEAPLTDAIEEGELHYKGAVDWNGITQIQTGLPGSGVKTQGVQPWKSEATAIGTLGKRWKYAFKGSREGESLKLEVRIDAVTGGTDAYVAVKADIQRPQIQGDITIHSHVTENAAFSISGLSARVTAEWGAGLKLMTSDSVNDILFLPIDVPIPIFPTVPMFFRVGANLAFIAGLVGRGTNASGHFEWTIGGSGEMGGASSGMPASSGEAMTSGTIGAGSNFNAVGGSAIGIVVNAPRFGISLGIPKATEAIYSIGEVVTLLANASGPLGGIVPCKSFELTAKASQSIEGKLLGITLWKTAQDLGAPYKSSWSSPEGVVCVK